MDQHLSTDRVAGTLGRLCRHWEDRRKAEASRDIASRPQSLTIALSRQAGVQGTAIGHEVGARLGWPVYDHELLERIAQDLGVRTSLLESVDERRVGWLSEAFEAVLSVPYANESAYVHRLVKAVLALGSHGQCVVVGRGSAFILPAMSTLRVRLIAPPKDRIATLGERLGVPLNEAKRRLGALDRERNNFVQDHFLRNPVDPQYYDLILNVPRYGVAGCANLIVHALESLQDQGPDPGSRKHPPEAHLADEAQQ